MSRLRLGHRNLAALAACLIVLLMVAWLAGCQSILGAGSVSRSSDAVRLGPLPGQPVAAYLTGLPVKLPPVGGPAVPALVELSTELDTSTAAALVAGTRPITAVLRVPLPRVQTALRFQRLTPVDDADPAVAVRRQLMLAQAAAARAAAADTVRLTSRPAQIATAEAAALSRPGCGCVLAVLVSADHAGLDRLAARPGVRAVDAAPVGTPETGVALTPLLPEQTELVGPVPDDGPEPPSP